MEDHQALHHSTTDAELVQAMSKLLPATSIEEYHIQWLINAACVRVPVAVVDLLLARIGFGRSGTEYQALPFSGELVELKRMSTVPQYAELLRRVRDKAQESEYPWTFWIPKLYKLLSGYFTVPASLQVLTEWVEDGSAQRLFAVSAILTKQEGILRSTTLI
jgi:hypothetical protein